MFSIAIIIGIVGSIVAGIVAKNEVVSLLAQLVSKVCEIMVFWFCISGIRNLAAKMNDRAIAEKADSFIKLIIGLFVAGIVLGIIGSFVKFGNFMNGLVNVASAVCAIVAYLSYLSLLKGAQDMLAR